MKCLDLNEWNVMSDTERLLMCERLTVEVNAKQARIDALMLEFCPDEMSDEQKAEWARHQCPVDDDILRAVGLTDSGTEGR
jgi:hypothetical protein